MRGSRMNGYLGEFRSSFLSCEKDLETIINKLLRDSRPYSDILKKLLLINTEDCLDSNNPAYEEKIKSYSIAKLIEEGYIRFSPKVSFGENEECKSYILISFDNFSPNGTNEYYRDCIVEVDIICNTDYWYLGNYRLRPLKIAGYIDGILNNNKLSGIGTLQFLGCNELALSESLSGYCLMYQAVHGVEDTLPADEGF